MAKTKIPTIPSTVLQYPNEIRANLTDALHMLKTDGYSAHIGPISTIWVAWDRARILNYWDKQAMDDDHLASLAAIHEIAKGHDVARFERHVPSGDDTLGKAHTALAAQFDEVALRDGLITRISAWLAEWAVIES